MTYLRWKSLSGMSRIFLTFPFTLHNHRRLITSLGSVERERERGGGGGGGGGGGRAGTHPRMHTHTH